jgi:hypothetical protein
MGFRSRQRARFTLHPGVPRVALAATVSCLSLIAAGCSSTGGFSAPPIARTGAPVTYLDVTDQATLDAISTGQASSISSPLPSSSAGPLPRWTVSYTAVTYAGTNPSAPAPGGAVSLDSVESAAAVVRPTVASVELGLMSALSGTSPATFGHLLAGLLEALRRAGALTVVVANLPPANLAPYAWLCADGQTAFSGYSASCAPSDLAGLISAYNAQIALVVREHHATLVDVNKVLAAAVSRHGAGYVFDASYSGLTPAGARVVLTQFRAAVRGKPLNTRGTRAA